MEATEVKKLIKELQTATTTGKPEDAVTILKQLKQNVVATEELLRETKAGLAIGKLRTHARKDIADLAKELVKKWKEAVEAGKKAKATGGTAAPAPTPVAEASKPQAKPQPTAAATSKPSPQPTPASTQPPSRKSSTATTPTPTTSAPPAAPAAISKPQPGVARSVKADGVKIESKGDKARDKCIELLYDAMASDSGAPVDQILKRAYGIEYTVYKEFDGVSKDYSTKMRRLYNNLKDKKNPGLRALPEQSVD